MPRFIVYLILITASTSTSWCQTTLNGPISIKGQTGTLRLAFPISGSCPNGATSTPGTAILCGHDNSVTLSINGGLPFILGPAQPSLTTAAQKDSQGETGSTGSRGPMGPPGQTVVPVDYAMVTPVGQKLPDADPGWTMPGGLTELFENGVRLEVDLSRASQARIFVQLGAYIGSPGAVIYVQFSLDGGQTWNRLTPSAAIDSGTVSVSAWGDIPSQAKCDLLVRAVSDKGTNGRVNIEALHLQIK